MLKTSDGQRIAIDPSEVDERQWSDVSLMPEGLAETMGEQDLVDLLAFLTTLRKPVSIVGLAQARRAGGRGRGRVRPLDLSKPINPQVGPKGPDGQTLSWRRLTADAEGRIDLAPFAAERGTGSGAVYLYTPVTAPVDQAGPAGPRYRAEDVRVWLGGRELVLDAAPTTRPRTDVGRAAEGHVRPRPPRARRFGRSSRPSSPTSRSSSLRPRPTSVSAAR